MFKSSIVKAEKMEILAKFELKTNTITLEENTLKYLEEFNSSEINIVMGENFSSKNYQLFQKISHSRNHNMGTSNAIWMRPAPVWDSVADKFVFFMEIDAVEVQTLEVLHTVASIISKAIVICLAEDDSTFYMGSTDRKIIDDHSLNRKKCNANLLYIIPQFNQYSNVQSNPLTIIMNKLSLQGVEESVIKMHPLLKAHEIPQDHIVRGQKNVEQMIQQSLQEFVSQDKQNKELMFGHIFVQYLKQICEQINRNGKISLQKAEQDIQIDEGYEAYMKGVKKYTDTSLKALKINQNPNQEQFSDILQQSKEAALEEYLSKGGAKSTKFRLYLQSYTKHKQQQIYQNYSNAYHNKNLEILENQSNKVLEHIKKNKLNEAKNSTELIQKQTDNMKQNYDRQAKGFNKYETYNEYMKIFLPLAFSGDKKKQTELQKELKRSEELRKIRNQLKEKEKNKCCQIM